MADRILTGTRIDGRAAKPFSNMKTWKDGNIRTGANPGTTLGPRIQWLRLGGSDNPLVCFPWKSFGGVNSGKITGNIYVTNTSTPTPRLVILYDLISRRLVGSAYGNAATGYFEFNNLHKGLSYFVVGIDLNAPLDVYPPPTNNAVAQDNLTPA